MLPCPSCDLSGLTLWVIFADIDLFDVSNWEILDSILVTDLSHIPFAAIHPWFYTEDKAGKITPEYPSDDELRLWLPGWSSRCRQ